MFARSDDKVNPCGFRLTQEGLPSLYPYLTSEKVVEIETESAKKLLSSENVALEDFNEKDRNEFTKLSSGCSVLVVRKEADLKTDPNDMLVLPICAWKGKNSMRAYIAKNERIHFLRICGADVTQTGKPITLFSIYFINLFSFFFFLYTLDAHRSTERERDKNKNFNKTNDLDIESNQIESTVS